jgi:hypothetical protein
MKTFLTLALLTGLSTSFHASALEGPMPHERSNTPLKSNAHVGRYLYVGVAPKFASHELDLTVSKMSLTLRVKGHISQEKMDGFASHLMSRWEKIDKTLQDPRFELHPLVKIMSLATKDSSIAWAKIASQYSSHVLENRGEEIYSSKRNVQSLELAGKEDQYRKSISNAILRYFFNNNNLKAEQVRSDNRLRDQLISVANSRQIFKNHYGSLFTASQEKNGYLGFITLVYPVAATVEGPYDQPKEASQKLMSYGTIEARWWSDKWQDEFAGMPFILINSAGVAFHAPITNFAPLDVWYLRRGYVSHGCHRMDASDLLELRNMLPKNLKDIGKVRLTILNNFDVTDWNNDGKEEVVDVKYYDVPAAVNVQGKTIDEAIAPYLVSQQMKSFYRNHKFASKFYNPARDTISGTTRYEIVNGQLERNGVHAELPLKRFEYLPSRILQYREQNVKMLPYDDNQGEYEPSSFLAE